MKRLTSLLISLVVINSGTVLALPTRTVYSQDAQATNSMGVDLKVWKGYGLTINFIPTGEIIKQVWLGDPSRFTLTSNGNLCQRGTSDSNCGRVGATVLFLRQIKPINFPTLTSSPDGSTVITVITASSDGQKQYQFKLIPARGKPQYTSLIIKPDSEKPLPILVRKQPAVTTEKPSQQQTVSAVSTRPTQNCRVEAGRGALVQGSRGEDFPSAPEHLCTSADHHAKLSWLTTSSSDVTTVKTTSTATTQTQALSNSSRRNDANAIAYGLAIANRNHRIKPGSTNWKKAQNAIRLLRRGKSREQAVNLSGIPLSIFNQLLEWGQ
jgi:hypothetical protein